MLQDLYNNILEIFVCRLCSIYWIIWLGYSSTVTNPLYPILSIALKLDGNQWLLVQVLDDYVSYYQQYQQDENARYNLTIHRSVFFTGSSLTQ